MLPTVSTCSMPHPLTERLIGEFDRMPARLQAAARFVLDQPQDVALLTMREQARRAGVPPATMTRLAQRLGLAGYDEIRTSYAAAMRKNAAGYAEKAADLVGRRGRKHWEALTCDTAQALAHHVGALGQPEAAAQLAAAAAGLAKASHIYCLGLRSSFPAAFIFHYICGMSGCAVTLLDGPGAIGADALAGATARDALLVTSVRPYTRLTIDAARQAKAAGLRLVAVTDSAVSPLASLAHHAILVGTASPSFFDSKTAALAAAEILAMLVTVRGGERSLAAVIARERYLASVDAYWHPATRKAPR
jgi:DNA-binding MurR/RpiR family transcriptional regulator